MKQYVKKTYFIVTLVTTVHAIKNRVAQESKDMVTATCYNYLQLMCPAVTSH